MDISIHAFICTRSKELKPVTDKLLTYLSSAGIKVKLIVGAKSIFSGYKTAYESAKPDPNDIVIMCHDDIEILSSPEALRLNLVKCLSTSFGFLGVAGTRKLHPSGVWWDQSYWQQGLHRGYVLHGTDAASADCTYYGKPGRALVMDGLFLACRAQTLDIIGLDKPDYLTGDWDFYDIHYTYEAHKKKLINLVVPIFILHNSSGYGISNDSWKMNREAFLKENPNLPLSPVDT